MIPDNKPSYDLKLHRALPLLTVQWDSAAWRHIPEARLTHFRPESSDHQPLTTVKLGATPNGVYGLFSVHDQYVLCKRTAFGEPVYLDSCVEFFLRPKPDKGYFNFEFNCGGALLASYITDSTRTKDGFKEYRRLPPDDGRLIRVLTSMPQKVEPEIAEETVWFLAFFVPYQVLEKYIGPLSVKDGDVWRANFYKCADECSHPHWGAWAPVTSLNFHLPACFGYLRLTTDHANHANGLGQPRIPRITRTELG